MSKEKVFRFFSKAAADSSLKEKLENTASQAELIEVAKETGYDFSSQHVDEAITEMKKQPGFFSMLAEAALEVFSPHHDDYPETGVQPYSGEPSSKR